MWTKSGPEFEADIGNVYIITKALYGLKSYGAEFRAFLV